MDPYNFPGSGSVPNCLDPDPDPTLMSTTKLTGTENVTTYGCCLAPGGPTDKGNPIKILKSNNLGTLPF